jgi:hypothetical protein
MSRNVEVDATRSSPGGKCSYLSCKGNCAACSAAQKQQCIADACDGLTASVRDRRENGGDHITIRARAFDLIRIMVADLEA